MGIIKPNRVKALTFFLNVHLCVCVCVERGRARGKAATAVFNSDRATKATAGPKPQIHCSAVGGVEEVVWSGQAQGFKPQKALW